MSEEKKLEDKPKESQDGVTVNSDDSVTFQVGENSYRIPKATRQEFIDDHRAVDQHLRSQRKGPIESILPEIEKLCAFPEIQKQLMDRAYADLKKGKEEHHVSNDDIRRWTDTYPGILFTMGRVFRRHYPDLTDADLTEIITRVGAGEMMKARDKIDKEAIEKITGKKLPE